MQIENKNRWRWSLHPEDPDYMDPPTEHDQEEPAPDIEPQDDDPRCDGPRNYVPMRGDV